MYRFDQGNLQNVPDYGSDMERDNARLEIEMRRLQATSAYNQADIAKRARMEAQIVAMKNNFLPVPMTQDLIGMNAYDAQQGQMQKAERQQYNNVLPGMLGVAGGLLGAGAGATFGRAGLANGLASAGTKVAGMSPIGSMADEVLRSASRGATNFAEGSGKYSAREGSLFEKLLNGKKATGTKAASVLDNLGYKIAGKGSTKAAGSVLGKIGGKVASKALIGGAIGGLPGFLVGTAIGAVIEGLMGGDEKDQAKARFMLSQYQ